MTQFSFTTDIEKRMPKTGEVACIDRMTSDYAAAHPFNVDNFIESVYQEFVGTEFEEPREVLRRLWADTLLMPAHGDPSVFPNKNGARRAAAMKVWHKAGDYWRKGFRLGDTLPDMVPMTRITRLGDGWWIALFPKDVLLLNDSAPSDTVAEPAATPVQEVPSEPAAVPQQEEPEPAVAPQQEEPEPAVTEPVRNQSEPQQLDLFAERKEEPAGGNKNLLRTAGYVAALTVALVVIWQTGLIIPLGLIGLATGGILK